MKRLILCVLMMMCASTAMAGDLYNDCDIATNGKQPDQTRVASCYSYLTGYTDATIAAMVLTKTKWVCIPENNTVADTARIFVKWRNDNPEKSHHDPSFQMIWALKNAFPCTK